MSTSFIDILLATRRPDWRFAVIRRTLIAGQYGFMCDQIAHTAASGPQALRAFVAAEVAKWTPVIKQAGGAAN